MNLNYRTLLVKSSAGQIVECTMSLQNYDALKVTDPGELYGFGRYDTVTLTGVQNERLRVFLEGLLAEQNQLPRSFPVAFDAHQVQPVFSPFRSDPVKRPLLKANLPEEAPIQCQFLGGEEKGCGRSPKKNQIYCGHHLRKAARKHSDRIKMKRSRSSNSDSLGDDDEPNYESISKDACSPKKKTLQFGVVAAGITVVDWDNLMARWTGLDQEAP